jgi:hypothetical protein
MNWQSVLRSSDEIGSRFSLVGVIPTAFLAVFVVALAWSGAPGHAPSPSRLLSAAKDLNAGQAVLLVTVVLLAALLLQPLQRPLVRMLEGYWAESPHCPAWLGMTARHGQRRRYAKLSGLAFRDFPCENDQPQGLDGYYVSHAKDSGRPLQEWRAHEMHRNWMATIRLHSRFPAEERILPTALGNALRAAEDNAGKRYGLDTVTVWPALYTVLSPAVREAVDDQRNQMDVSARLSVVLSLCALASAIMLWRYPYWLLGSLVVTLLIALFAYRAAVVAAESYGVMIRLAFDRHRFDLLAALHLPQPADSAAESESNQQLTAYLQRNAAVTFHYQHSGSQDLADPSTAPGPDAAGDQQPGQHEVSLQPAAGRRVRRDRPRSNAGDSQAGARGHRDQVAQPLCQRPARRTHRARLSRPHRRRPAGRS